MTSAFSTRHIGTDADAQALMLNRLGYDTLEDLMTAAVPGHLRMVEIARSVIPPAASEAEALAELRELANANTVRRSLIGLGYYGTHTPSVIKRNVLENPSWYTAYTPYQPEISQGRLEALLNFQTMVADLTGMATANASMLDEATAVAEAMLLARRVSGQESSVFVIDADSLPQTKAVLAGRAEPLGIQLVESDFTSPLPEWKSGISGQDVATFEKSSGVREWIIYLGISLAQNVLTIIIRALRKLAATTTPKCQRD